MKDKKYTAKGTGEIFGMATRKVEATRRILRYKDTFPDIHDAVMNGKLKIHRADLMISARLTGKEIPICAKIPLNDAQKAAGILFAAMRNGRTDSNFIKSLGFKLLGIEPPDE